MLAYFLALAVGLGSFSIYMAAFFFPEVHRKSDFAWSGVGLFYALILWACAGRITGALLLGQMAGVAVLGSFAWETLTLRRLVTPVSEQTPIPQAANLAGAMGAPLSGLFGKKQEPAAKKPKFVRSPKPKADVVPAPAVNQGEVKLEEQPAVPPIPEIIAESAIAPDLAIPDSKPPAIAEIPVFSVENPAAETSPPPAESAASSFTPLPLEKSEIDDSATVEPAEAQPEVKQQPEADDFDEMWRARVKESQSAASSAAPAATPTAAPTANSTPAKTAKKAGGFGSLFGNIKNSLGGMLGRGAGKNKSDASAPVTTAKATPEPIAPESKITAIPAPDIDRILESELASAAAEVAAETSNTAVETSEGVPFPTDVEAMAELMAAQTASSAKIGENSIEERSSAETRTTPPDVDKSEPEAAEPVSIEMTVVEIAEPVEIEVPGEPGLRVQVETVSVSAISIESTEEKPSSDGEQPDRVETAQRATESKSENVSGEHKPSA
ncbi:Ycf66 family protein [Microcoleus sp. ARI1-B5]|uniref:Ycf66 family protein n=1 Tax=unclassified Microcoleus TaxID=2642155 RepID=UPI002FD099E1